MPYGRWLSEPAARSQAHHSDPITPSNKPKQTETVPGPRAESSLARSPQFHVQNQTLSHSQSSGGVAPSFSYPRLRSLSPSKGISYSGSHATLAERRNQSPLSQLRIQLPHASGSPASQSVVPVEAMPGAHKVKDRGATEGEYDWASESAYSGEDDSAAQVSPLNLPFKADGRVAPGLGHSVVLQQYSDWAHSSSVEKPAQNRTDPGDSYIDSAKDGLLPKQRCGGDTGPRHLLYSPLTPFFANDGMPPDKKGSKAMFGQNGWLERTEQPFGTEKIRRKKSMFNGLKKIARDLVRGWPSLR
jgi:hypothetical protein